jgi:hypothetical protein
MDGFSCVLVTNGQLTSWSGNWAWGMPLIVLTVLIHALGLGLIRQRALNASSHSIRRHPTGVFVGVIGFTTYVATSLTRYRGDYLGCGLSAARRFT